MWLSSLGGEHLCHFRMPSTASLALFTLFLSAVLTHGTGLSHTVIYFLLITCLPLPRPLSPRVVIWLSTFLWHVSGALKGTWNIAGIPQTLAEELHFHCWELCTGTDASKYNCHKSLAREVHLYFVKLDTRIPRKLMPCQWWAVTQPTLSGQREAQAGSGGVSACHPLCSVPRLCVTLLSRDSKMQHAV